MSRTREIPSRDWNSYLSSLAEDRPRVSVQVAGGSMGEQPLVEQLSLRRFEVEEKGSEKGSIEIEFGGRDGGFSHQISEPEHVWVIESDDGEPSSIDIEGRDDVKTIIRFD